MRISGRSRSVRAVFAVGDGMKFGRNLGAKSGSITPLFRPFRRVRASKGSTFNGTYRCGIEWAISSIPIARSIAAVDAGGLAAFYPPRPFFYATPPLAA